MLFPLKLVSRAQLLDSRREPPVYWQEMGMEWPVQQEELVRLVGTLELGLNKYW